MATTGNQNILFWLPKCFIVLPICINIQKKGLIYEIKSVIFVMNLIKNGNFPLELLWFPPK